MSSPENISIFITYAVEDQPILDKLLEHLSPLLHNGLVNNIHHNGSIDAGLNWEKATQDALSSADIILLLVSSDFMASDNCYNKDMQAALSLESQGDVRTIPVIARSCLWEDSPFSKLKALPAGGKKAITDSGWGSPDEPYTEIVRSIRELILEMKGIKKNKIQRGETIAPREIALFKNNPEPERKKGFTLKIFGIPIISLMLTLGIAVFLVVPILLKTVSNSSDVHPGMGDLRDLKKNEETKGLADKTDTVNNMLADNTNLKGNDDKGGVVPPPNTGGSKINTGGQTISPTTHSKGKTPGGKFKSVIIQDPVTRLYGFVINANDTIPPSYQAVLDFSQGLAAAKINNKWGFINPQGDVVIDFLYNEAKSFTDTIAEVKLNKKWVKINKRGGIIDN